MALPAHLAERIDPRAPSWRDGHYVIYWTRVAVRATENPALDVALTVAKERGVPCFVYCAVSERYRYASDRLHTFMLQGARDVQQALEARGIGFVFHLQHPGDRTPRLLELASRAALVVTDFMPLQPFLAWDAQVAQQAPLWRVDASCVAPVWAVPRRFDRAFAFTAAVKPLWRERLSTPWVDVQPPHPPFVPDVPFTPVNLRDASIPELVASCDIDHTVGPVHHTVGGAEAGLARWKAFVDTALDGYAKGRNDPLSGGVSRMSAYLHFGHVSAFRLAREAAARKTDGAEKYLDELLTWRELAWNLCLHTPDVESVSALPEWAIRTLKDHEGDPRPALPSWDVLARGRTDDPLWNAAQHSLLTNGELHNSVRMTWGKALLGWTRTAAEALALLFDLNHRYALDGRDPASAGGILWCLGALDRPFSPEVPILGAVRPRSTRDHAKRFDVAEYGRRTRRPSRGKALTVAVIGAGVSGASAARALLDAGHAVTVFERSHAPGGRLSTRHVAEHRFDDGAQYLTVRDPRFERLVQSLRHERLLAQWNPRLATVGTRPEREPSSHAAPVRRWVPTPSMAVLVERLLHGVDVRVDVEVSGLSRSDGRWRLRDAAQHALGEFDAVVVATPAPQAATLVDPSSFALASRVREVELAPCQVSMLAFAAPLDVDFDAAFVNVGPLRWVARESSKPERAEGERWVLHATSAWSAAHQTLDSTRVTAALLDAFWATTGAAPVEPVLAETRCWPQALVVRPLGEPCLFDADLQLAACGDWCLGSRIEAAFLSGSAAAGRLNGLPSTEPMVSPTPVSRGQGAQLRLI